MKKVLKEAIDTALQEDTQLIIEATLVGMEISVGAYNLDNQVIILPITEIISENDFFDFDANTTANHKKLPGPTDEATIVKIHDNVKKLHQQLRLQGVCRSEFIIVEGIPHLLEVNTIPGLTAASLIPQQVSAAGIELADFFESLLMEKMKPS